MSVREGVVAWVEGGASSRDCVRRLGLRSLELIKKACCRGRLVAGACEGYDLELAAEVNTMSYHAHNARM